VQPATISVVLPNETSSVNLTSSIRVRDELFKGQGGAMAPPIFFFLNYMYIFYFFNYIYIFEIILNYIYLLNF